MKLVSIDVFNQAKNQWQKERLRQAVWLTLWLALFSALIYFVFSAWPRHFRYSISAGDILSTRHHLARSLQAQSTQHEVTLALTPSLGSRQSLEWLEQGKLDFAIVHAGMNIPSPHIRHVATLHPELIHCLIKPGQADLASLRGKRINLSGKQSATHFLSKQVLKFANLQEGSDYVETNFSSEELISLPLPRLPDVIFITALAPSDTVNFLVRQHGYTLLELPFGAAMAMHANWVADGQIPAFSYKVQPTAVPRQTIHTIGVQLYLVAHEKVDPHAVRKVLESLYSPELASREKISLNETQITRGAFYPLSEGTRLFMARNDSVLSNAAIDQYKSWFGMVLSIGSGMLALRQWLRKSSSPEPAPADEDFARYIQQVLKLEATVQRYRAEGNLSPQRIVVMHQVLMKIKTRALTQLASAKFDNPQLPAYLLDTLAEARRSLSR